MFLLLFSESEDEDIKNRKDEVKSEQKPVKEENSKKKKIKSKPKVENDTNLASNESVETELRIKSENSEDLKKNKKKKNKLKMVEKLQSGEKAEEPVAKIDEAQVNDLQKSENLVGENSKKKKKKNKLKTADNGPHLGADTLKEDSQKIINLENLKTKKKKKNKLKNVEISSKAGEPAINVKNDGEEKPKKFGGEFKGQQKKNKNKFTESPGPHFGSNKKRKFENSEDGSPNKKKFKNNRTEGEHEHKQNIPDNRLKAFGINPKKFNNKMKYGNKFKQQNNKSGNDSSSFSFKPKNKKKKFSE